MRTIILAAGLLAILAACDSDGTNPFDSGSEAPDDGGGSGTGDDGTPIDSDRTLPPGTDSPTPSNSIFRREAQDGESGNGYAESFSYDSDNDTFTVDGLAFDGENTYQRGTAVSSLGPFAVYEADSSVTDSFSGDPVGQFTYRAIYGVSNSGNAEFAVVRTGSYIDYGFGGFIYQRNGGVTLPGAGQAVYTGEYAGLRDFDGTGGLQYTTADMTIGIDFEDFNSGDGVYGSVENRRVYDLDGNDVTADVLSAINAEYDASLTELPDMIFLVGPGVMDANGELAGDLYSAFVADDGTTVDFESGNYYAIVAGDNAEEIVGIVVVEGDIGDVTARETGGFVVYR